MADSKQSRASNCCHSFSDEGAVYLPPEIISNILSWLPIESILRCKSVCKTWNNMVKDSHFVHLQLSRTYHQPSRLILLSKSLKNLLLLDTEEHKARELPIYMESVQMMGSCNGLLCVVPFDRRNLVVVCNPIIGKSIVLPKLKPEVYILSAGIGFDPFTKKYKVVRVYPDYMNICNFEIMTLGEGTWRPLEVPYCIHEIGTSEPVFLDGYLHWFIEKEVLNIDRNYILALDLSTEKFVKVSVLSVYGRTVNWKLLKWGGYLILAVLDHHYQLMRKWHVTGHEVKSLCIRNKKKYKVYSPRNGLSYREVISKPNRDSYLLEAYSRRRNGKKHLVQCFPRRKKHYFHLDIHGVHDWHKITRFEPTLVSPLVASLGGCL